MKIVADIHLHSYFSRATSKNLNLENLHKWAQLKGVTVVGTGDIAHPGWLSEMKEKLDPAEDGLFKLKEHVARPVQSDVFKSCHGPVRFMLAGEISNIYKRHDKVRKIHNVVFMPSFDALEKFQARLEQIGNIRSDGRPILGLDTRDLLEIVLETDPQGYLIPAHIWTPWFAMLGSMSGFDSVEECFGDLTEHIFALETGLSSDPPMNWRLSMLDDYTLVSNSDAHSPPKLGREANLFETELSYSALFDALKTGDPNRFLGTIEFFPEEGKYHYDGHRKCRVRWGPKETLAHDCVCPECGKKVTVGVMHRVETLADRDSGEHDKKGHPYHSLVPLQELLAEIHSVGVNSKKVKASWDYLLTKLGPELFILQDAPLEEIEHVGGAMVAEGIRRMRSGNIQITSGFDGEYGVIRVFKDEDRQKLDAQLALFVERVKEAVLEHEHSEQSRVAEKSGEDVVEKKTSDNLSAPRTINEENGRRKSEDLNPAQQLAVTQIGKPCLIIAGPGTGKTRTLTHKIAYLIKEKRVKAENILALTFTNGAAKEMSGRLSTLVGKSSLRNLTIATFHALAANILRQGGHVIGIPASFNICQETDRFDLLRTVAPSLTKKEMADCLDKIALAKSNLIAPENSKELASLSMAATDQRIYSKYQEVLKRFSLLDFEDLLFQTVKFLEHSAEDLASYRDKYKWIFVDEYQDINEAQNRLLRLLVKDNPNIFAIGDPDQAIYGFRGAARSYFHQFGSHFPDAQTIKLDRSYRSTQTILDASIQVIADRKASGKARLWSEIVSKTKIAIHRAVTDKAEAEYVVQQIESALGGTSYFSIDSGRVAEEHEKAALSLADFAVLFRTRSQAPPLLEAFQRSGIPFQLVGETPFFQEKLVQEILNYLHFIQNEHDSFHLEKIIEKTNVGFGQSALSKLAHFAQQNDMTLWDALIEVDKIPDLDSKQKRGAARIETSLGRLKTLAQDESAPIVQIIKDIIDLHTLSKGKDSDSQKELLQKLILRAKPYENDLQKFLQDAALAAESDEYDAKVDRVTLMTLHAAKGLEFPIVFIVGCEEGLIPYTYSGKESNQEEERRLLYVGMTRAKAKLYLCHARKRFLFGKFVKPAPSQFLNKIENDLKALSFTRKIMKKDSQKSLQDPQIELF